MIRNYTFYKDNENRLYENIESAFKRIDSELSLYDDSYDWNLYTSYGKGFMQTGKNKNEGYEYEKSWDYDLIIIERIKPSCYFGEAQKDWFIFQNGGYSELYPDLKSYDDCFQWSSKDYSEEDIYEVINSGGVEPSQKEFIENLFEFDDTPVEEICTHRSEVVCLYLNDDKETWKKTILENRHTLYPVCDEDNDDVVGILDTRDYFRLDSIEQDNVINKAMDQPFFISQNMKADVLLKEMKIKKVYFAVLLDEYGGMTGIVTLHDIIETLLGEIQEDDDIDEPDPIQQIDADQFRIYGQADIEDVEKALGISLEDEDCDTFGGYILNHYGQIPDEGSHFKVSLDLMDVYVKEVKNHRIGQTIVQIKRKEEGNQHESTEKRNRD